jgi:hypothetical protein
MATEVHGTTNCYNNWGCRCDLCRKAWTDYMRILRQNKVKIGICRDCLEPAEQGKTRCTKHLAIHAKRHREMVQKNKALLSRVG